MKIERETFLKITIKIAYVFLYSIIYICFPVLKNIINIILPLFFCCKFIIVNFYNIRLKMIS